jgi:hypothetical protein
MFAASPDRSAQVRRHWRGRATHIVNENVQAAEASEHSLDDFLHTITCADVSLNKQIRQ